MALNVRVTQRAMTRQYIKNSNTALSQMNKLNNQILTKRKFMRASENPAGAARALTVRKGLANLEMYKTNLQAAQGIFNSAESSLLTVSDQTKNVTDRLIYGVNGDKAQSDRIIIAEEIKRVAEGMMAQMNNDYAERRLFGGTNNSSAAFTYENGEVKFNGVALNDLDKPSEFPGINAIYIDVGIGIKYNDDGTVDPQTALDIALNGAELTGCGVDEDGDSKNLIQLAFDSAEALRNGDLPKARALIDKVKAAQETLLTGITNLGVREQSVEFYQTKAASDGVNLAEAQINAEGMSEMDLAEAITNFKTIEAAYNATLQMGSKVVPASIFDFIR